MTRGAASTRNQEISTPSARCLPALAAALALALAPVPAPAANADNPQGNIDRSNDAGDDTGDSKVDELNKGQLDENQGQAKPANERAATPK